MKTLVGLMPDEEHVANAGKALHVAGIRVNNIRTLFRPVDVWEWLGGPRKVHVVFSYAFLGVLFGLAVGAVYGVVAGVLNCSLMGCPATTSLVRLLIIALFWIISGAAVGFIIGLDRLEDNLYSYLEGVRRGAALLVVEMPDAQAAEVTRILQQADGLLVHSIASG